MENPKISVIIPHYNHREYLPQAVESILAQTYQNFEIIIVEQVNYFPYRFGNPKIRVLAMDFADKAKALNYGIKEAKGEWIAFQDADDLSMNYRFSYVWDEKDMIYGDMINIDRKGVHKYVKALPFTAETLQKSSLQVFSSIMIKTEIARQVPFREGFGYGDDYIWTCDLLKSELIKRWSCIPIPLYYHRDYTSTYRLRPGKHPYINALRNRWKLRKMRGKVQKTVAEIL